ncbi:MAG: gamma-glutamyl-gamma-aminobutyrate hydrolase family protein [Clostridiales bacterium]|nr:gamma-glutamyl-gamma-aminobutyrate hydrolase family protein [Clostridiales bacterium]
MPRILISGSREGCDNYINAVRAAGGEPFGSNLPPGDGSYEPLRRTRGDQMDPAYFNQPNTASHGIDLERDEVELALARLYLSLGKPILGICRGHQLLNVALGGDLRQDIGDPLHLFHTRGELPQDRVHPVHAAPGSFLEVLYGPVFPVNSSHHQVVERLGEGLRAAAWSESGLVEALEHESLPVRTVQWHPERMSYGLRRPDTVDGAPIFQWLVAAAGK